jgi:type IV pilus assembly protein PilQ
MPMSAKVDSKRIASLAAVWSVAAILACAPAWAAPAEDKAKGDEKTGGSHGVAVTRPGTFEIHVQGADLRGVLQLLSTQGKRNIIATAEVRGTVTADLYGVDFYQALNAILRSSGFDYIEDKDGLINVYTKKQKEELVKSQQQVTVKVFRLSYLQAADAQVLLTPALSPTGSIVVTPAAVPGIAPSKTIAGGNTYSSEDRIVVRDLPENLAKVEKLLKELDVKPDQVLIEATILSCELTETNKLGVNFNLLGGASFKDVGATASTTGTPKFTPGDLTQANFNAVNFRTDFAPITGGMSLGIFGKDVSFLITALEGVSDTTVLANPKLMVVNKQKGEVMIGRRDGYLTTTITETSATQTVEFLETGTRLIVRPFIGADGYVRMEVHPEDSDGSVENSLPSETTTEVTTNVLVRDGHTIIIGGLFRENVSTGINQVPFLGNIPYLGTLFRTTNDGTGRNEVIILLTPHIVNQGKAEAVGEQLKDDGERLRMGQRKGLPCWSSERLAQANLNKAKELLRQGDRDGAMWRLDLALSMRRSFIEAIRLKETLTGEAYWHDNTRMSAVHHVIPRMIMHELGKPFDTVVLPDKPRNGEGLSEDAKKALGIEPILETPIPGAKRTNAGRSEIKPPLLKTDGKTGSPEAPMDGEDATK